MFLSFLYSSENHVPSLLKWVVWIELIRHIVVYFMLNSLGDPTLLRELILNYAL